MRAPPAVGLMLPAALLLVAALGCHWSDAAGPACDGSATPGEVSLWTACEPSGSAGRVVELLLTNDSGEPVWYFDDCSEPVPWLAREEQDGSWSSLLPPGTSLPLACEHVEELAPGATVALPTPTAGVAEPGIHRAETTVAWGCEDVHDARHVPSACDRLTLVASAPFELRP